MNAQALILPLVQPFVHCFTAPGFVHFAYFVVAHMALLWEYGTGQWVGFPVAALLFVPRLRCSTVWPFLSKLDLAERVLRWPASRVIVVVDNLYATAQLARVVVNGQRCCLVSRLRSTAALYLPPPRRPPRRGRPRVRRAKLTARQLYRRRSQRYRLTVRIYGKRVRVDAYVGVIIPSRRLGNEGLRVVIFPNALVPRWTSGRI